MRAAPELKGIKYAKLLPLLDSGRGPLGEGLVETGGHEAHGHKGEVVRLEQRGVVYDLGEEIKEKQGATACRAAAALAAG